MSRRAERSLERITRRWHEHADYPDVFRQEVLDAILLLETTRSPGTPYASARYPHMKRLLLRKSGCHLYFRVIEERQAIEIMLIWDARRGRLPKL